MGSPPRSPWECLDCNFSELYPAHFAQWRSKLGFYVLIVAVIAVLPWPLVAWRSQKCFPLLVRQPATLLFVCFSLLLNLITPYREWIGENNVPCFATTTAQYLALGCYFSTALLRTAGSYQLHLQQKLMVEQLAAEQIEAAAGDESMIPSGSFASEAELAATSTGTDAAGTSNNVPMQKMKETLMDYVFTRLPPLIRMRTQLLFMGGVLIFHGGILAIRMVVAGARGRLYATACRFDAGDLVYFTIVSMIMTAPLVSCVLRAITFRDTLFVRETLVGMTAVVTPLSLWFFVGKIVASWDATIITSDYASCALLIFDCALCMWAPLIASYVLPQWRPRVVTALSKVGMSSVLPVDSNSAVAVELPVPPLLGEVRLTQGSAAEHALVDGTVPTVMKERPMMRDFGGSRVRFADDDGCQHDTTTSVSEALHNPNVSSATKIGYKNDRLKGTMDSHVPPIDIVAQNERSAWTAMLITARALSRRIHTPRSMRELLQPHTARSEGGSTTRTDPATTARSQEDTEIDSLALSSSKNSIVELLSQPPTSFSGSQILRIAELLVLTETGRREFIPHLAAEFAVETVLFLVEAARYRKAVLSAMSLPDGDPRLCRATRTLRRRLRAIVETYIEADAPRAVNLSGSVAARLIIAVTREKYVNVAPCEHQVTEQHQLTLHMEQAKRGSDDGRRACEACTTESSNVGLAASSSLVSNFAQVRRENEPGATCINAASTRLPDFDEFRAAELEVLRLLAAGPVRRFVRTPGFERFVEAVTCKPVAPAEESTYLST